MTRYFRRHSSAIGTLEAALRQQLPGHAAQLLMCPQRLGRRPAVSPIGKDCRKSAVLLLLYPKSETTHFVLMQRPATMAQHAGQISLPGGARDGSESLPETALRETEEEIGVPRHNVRIIGSLTSLFIDRSNFCVTPYVAVSSSHPEFKSNPEEVDGLIEPSIESLIDPELKRMETWHIDDREVQVPFYTYEGAVIWGATAMILSEFEQILHRAK